jgi:predicted nucleic acid-binding Zn ribbon protein
VTRRETSITGSRKGKRSPALIAPPAKISALLRLVNLLPKYLRQQSTDPKPPPALVHGRMHVLEYWDYKTDEDILHRVWYFYVLSDALPLELQAFILHDDDGRCVEYSTSLVPFFDPEHLQPYTNINLTVASELDLQSIVKAAKARISVEETEVESRAEVEPVFHDRFDYEVGESKFMSSGLLNLVNRARQRLLFVLAAEEVLNALSGPDTQERLNRARYVDQSGATRGHLYVKDGEVKLSPPVLFSFVVGVDATRVRKCKVCENYFWAGRKDKQLCSEKCDATNRKRNERDRYRKTGKWKRYLREKTPTVSGKPLGARSKGARSI